MRKSLLACCLTILPLLPAPLSSQTYEGDLPPKREVRAAWLTSFAGLDWPKTAGTTAEVAERQKAELIEILDRLKEANFNTVLFQVRVRGNVLYRSRLETWSDVLVGEGGGEPAYDPLAFAVEECHRRGMECHAWLATIPIGPYNHSSATGKKSVVKQHPKICVRYGNSIYLNPGHPETKEYLADLASEIVEAYDVDGIHLDYLRYPERSPKFPDAKEYRRYGQGRSREQWRCDNITAIVRLVYREVKARKPWVKVSTSPVGKYDDTTRYPSRGWNALHVVGQDVHAWLAEGIQDQIYPMLYFNGNNFYPFALDWQENACGRQVIAGLGVYFLDPREGNWKPEEVERQINFVRTYGLDGQAHYRVEFLMKNVQGLYDLVERKFYTAPALIPAMTWVDSIAPTAPTELRVTPLAEGYTRLSWRAATDEGPTDEVTYVVYGSRNETVDIGNPECIIAMGIRGTEFVYAPSQPTERCTAFAVTAVDRCGNESPALTVE